MENTEEKTNPIATALGIVFAVIVMAGLCAVVSSPVAMLLFSMKLIEAIMFCFICWAGLLIWLSLFSLLNK